MMEELAITSSKSAIFRLFGGIEAQVGDRRLDLGSEKERRLLVALLLAKGRPVPREELPDWIWDKTPESVFGDLDRFMSKLRKRLDEIGLCQTLVNRGGLCRLDIPADTVDVHRFRALVAEAHHLDDPRAASLLAEALELSRGEPFAGVSGLRINNYRHALSEERHSAELTFVQVEFRLGHYQERIADLARLSADRPEDTSVAGLNMYALHLAGRQAEALEVYKEHRCQLEAIGLEVPQQLAELHVRMLRNDDSLRPEVGAWSTQLFQSPSTSNEFETASGVLPVRAAELDASRDWAVPPNETQADGILDARHLVVLVGDPADGRTTALRLLGDRSRRDGLKVLDVVKHWTRPTVALLPPLGDACGYLLNLNDPATDHAAAAFAEDLLTHAGRLADRRSYLIVTVRPELWRDCWQSATAVTVQLPPPDPTPEREHLRLTDPDGHESVYPLRDGRTPRAQVSLGRAVSGDPPPDVVLASGASSLVSRRHAWLEHGNGEWWLVRSGKNRPSIRRRGAIHTERIEDRARLRDGDVILIEVGAYADGQPRAWELEFRDPQETKTSRGDDQ